MAKNLKLGTKETELSLKIGEALEETKKVIVGQEKMLSNLVVAMLCRGHVLLEGVPGLAKTLSVKTLARSIACSFSRIQFTPDLLPADLTGTRIYNVKTGAFTVQTGPLFANIVLADEINRAPAKVQSALLEAMQEKQVTIGEKTFVLEEPFTVMATQNPIETEGTYRLPEAQVDRFLLKTIVGYPSKNEETEIINRMTTGENIEVRQVLKPKDIIEAREYVDSVYVDEKIKQYVTDIVFATRTPAEYGLELENMIDFGCSPRASIALVMTGKAKAYLDGRAYVMPDDIKASAHDVLRHRIILSYEAEAEEMTTDSIIDSILNKVKVP